MAVVTPLNNPGGPEGDTVTMAEQLLNTEYNAIGVGRIGHKFKNICRRVLQKVPKKGVSQFLSVPVVRVY